MVAEHKIDRQELISGHNPVLTEIATDAPLTVGNGELAFTADITGTGKQGKVQLYTG